MNEQEIIKQIEENADALMPELAEKAIETVTVVKNNPYILAGTTLVGLGVGMFVGYKASQKRLEREMQDMLEEEIARTKEFYTTLAKAGDYSTPEQAAEKLIPKEEQEAKEAFDTYREGAPVVKESSLTSKFTVSEDDENGDEVEVTEEVEARNIFVDGRPLDEDEFDFDAEVAKRTEDRPYIITEDEYMTNEQDFIQMDLTYYEGDDVLADEHDASIDDVEGLVGEENLKHFGHGSSSKNIVYIKNNKRGIDCEIVRSRGKYAVEVLGLDDEDNRVRNPKFRAGDE